MGVPVQPETKQQSVVWVFPDENPPVKFRRNKSSLKQMIAHVLAKYGHVATKLLVVRRRLRLTGMLTTVCLKSSRHGTNSIPDQAYAVFYSIMISVAHTQQLKILDFPAASDVQLVTHPPHAPDIALCD